MEPKTSEPTSSNASSNITDKPDCSTCGTDHPNPVHRAAYVGHVECVKYVFRNLKDTSILLDSDNNSPLHASVAGGQVVVLKYLLQFTRIPIQYQNNQGETCVHTAGLRHRLECLKVLLGGSFKKAQSYASIKDRLGCTVLHYAVLVNDNDCALWLLQRFGKNLANTANEDDVLPLHVAAAQGNIEFIRTATKYDLSMVNKRDRNGATPAFYSVQSGYLQCLKYLVEKAKADVHTLTNRGQSLLHAACLNGHGAVVQWLFTKMEKSAVYQQTNDAATTFHCAAFGGHDAILNLLHKVAGNRRFAVSSTDRRGNTALHLAALNGYVNCVQFLLQLGAEPRMKNLTGHTCIDMAEKREHDEVANCLLASVLGSKESAKRKYVRHKSHNDISTTHAERVRPNSLSTSGYSSGAAASDGYGRTALPLNSASYNEPSSGYASSSDKGTKEPNALWASEDFRKADNNATTDASSSSLLETNWLLRRKEAEESVSKETVDNNNLHKLVECNKVAVKLKTNYSIFQQPSIELISPRQACNASYGGGPILINREVQTDFDPLEDNIIIVDENERIIFSSVPSIPTVFAKTQQQHQAIQDTSSSVLSTAVGQHFDSESQKRTKKRRRKPSLRERRKPSKNSTTNIATESDFWASSSQAEMQERKRTNSDASSSSTDSGRRKTAVAHIEKFKTPEHQHQTIAATPCSTSHKDVNMYAGIQAAEKIDEYLRGEPEDNTDTDDDGNFYKILSKNSQKLASNNNNITTAVVHKSKDDGASVEQRQESPKTLDRKVTNNGQPIRQPLRRPSDLGEPMTLPVWHDPCKTLDFKPLKLFSASNDNVSTDTKPRMVSHHSVAVNRTYSMKGAGDGSMSVKSASMNDVSEINENASPSETLGRTSNFRVFGKNSASLTELCCDTIDKKLSYAAEIEYGTLKPLPAINNRQHKEDCWLKSLSSSHDDDFPPPPPLPTAYSIVAENNANANNCNANSRLFYKRSAAGAFKARDKLLSEHLKINAPREPNGVGGTLKSVVRQSVSEIRRQLEDKLISHVHNGGVAAPPATSSDNNDNVGDNAAQLSSQTSAAVAVCNKNVFSPIKSTLSSAANSYQQTTSDKNTPVVDKVVKSQQSYRYFGTSNASDYALRGRINEIIRLGAATAVASKDNVVHGNGRRIYDLQEKDEDQSLTLTAKNDDITLV